MNIVINYTEAEWYYHLFMVVIGHIAVGLVIVIKGYQLIQNWKDIWDQINFKP